jgi:hypothetical protein
MARANRLIPALAKNRTTTKRKCLSNFIVMDTTVPELLSGNRLPNISLKTFMAMPLEQ